MKLQELVRELRELQADMEGLLEDARHLIQEADRLAGTTTLPAAEAYWLAHAKCALTNKHEYLGGSMTTMDDTLAALEEGAVT